MSVILDFNAARRARGLPVLASPARLAFQAARSLRLWRCFEARIGQREAAKLAGPSIRTPSPERVTHGAR